MEPIRVMETVKIGEREFTVQELTVREIMNLISGSAFISGFPKKEIEENKKEEESSLDWSLFGEFSGIGRDLERIMGLSCVNFKMEDLMELTPSSVKKVVEAFKKVNNDFLSSLKALGVAKALKEIREAALSGFSKTFVTLLRQDM